MSERPPTLTDLVRKVASETAKPSPPPLPEQQRRRRPITSELPAIAKKYGQLPLTIGMAVAIAVGALKLWDIRGEVDKATAATVARYIAHHNEHGNTHATQLDRLRATVAAHDKRMTELDAAVRQLREQLTPRRRRRR